MFTQIRIVHIYNAIFFGGSTIEVFENVGKLWNVPLLFLENLTNTTKTVLIFFQFLFSEQKMLYSKMNTNTISKRLMWEYSLSLSERFFNLCQVVCKDPATGHNITFSSWILCATFGFLRVICINWLWGRPQKFNVCLLMIGILDCWIAM